MARIEKTVFISYRRANLPWALCIYQNLTQDGYDVFFDFQSIDSGSFETAILDNIRARAHFVLILTPSSLERCKNPNDWLRREIETAIDEKRNIVPLMLEGFDFGTPTVQEALTGKLSVISSINALPIHNAYVFEGMERLRTRFLNVTLEDINLPTLQANAQEITKSKQSIANEAKPVSEEQLTAQTWFESAYVFHESGNKEEAFRCYSEAIKLDPNFDTAHNNLGILLNALNRYDEAESAYRKAIELNPAYDKTYYNLGLLLGDLKRYDEAETSYRTAIKINPAYDMAYNNLGLLLHIRFNRYDQAESAYHTAIQLNPTNYKAHYNLGKLFKFLKRYDEAENAFHTAIEINPTFESTYYHLACLKSITEDIESAFEYLEKASKMDGFSRLLAWHDTELVNLRKDPRFVKFAGEYKDALVGY